MSRNALFRATTGLAAAAGLAFASPAAAQITGDNATEILPQGDISKTNDGKRMGWDGALSLGANISLTQNRRVVGQPEGVSVLFGVSLLAGLDYIHGKHEIRNTLLLTESWAKTPGLDEFVKNADVLDIESLYNYFITSWFGAFGRLSLSTSILPGEDVRAESVVYRDEGGARADVTATRLDLSDPFQPLQLAESIGAFLEPIHTEPFSFSFRVGVGSRQTFADGVLLLTGTADDDAVTYAILSDVIQGGVEAFAGIKGKLLEKRLTYELGGNILVPVLNNDPIFCSGIQFDTLANNIQEGWTCIAVRAEDYLGNIGVSPILPVCVDYEPDGNPAECPTFDPLCPTSWGNVPDANICLGTQNPQTLEVTNTPCQFHPEKQLYLNREVRRIL